MRLVTVVFFLLILSGCVTRQVQTLASLPLPAEPQRTCCWQALQQLRINFNNESFELRAALAMTNEGVTLVLLDPFGRRLLSLHKSDDIVETYRAPELPPSLPGKFLLASSLLAWLPMRDWDLLLTDASGQPWKLVTDQHQRVLSHKKRNLIRFNYSSQAESLKNGMGSWTVSRHETLELHHLYQPLSITIRTERWDAL